MYGQSYSDATLDGRALGARNLQSIWNCNARICSSHRWVGLLQREDPGVSAKVAIGVG